MVNTVNKKHPKPTKVLCSEGWVCALITAFFFVKRAFSPLFTPIFTAAPSAPTPTILAFACCLSIPWSSSDSKIEFWMVLVFPCLQFFRGRMSIHNFPFTSIVLRYIAFWGLPAASVNVSKFTVKVVLILISVDLSQSKAIGHDCKKYLKSWSLRWL